MYLWKRRKMPMTNYIGIGLLKFLLGVVCYEEKEKRVNGERVI
jgi:hypothetical protein